MCVMTYYGQACEEDKLRSSVQNHCMSACLCVYICCKHVGVNVGVSCVAMYQSLLGGFSPVDSFLICCPCGAYLLIRCVMYYAVKHVCDQHFCLYVCACICCNQCAHSYISWRLPMLKPSPVSTPCTGSSKAMSAAKDQRCRGSMVTTCIFVNLHGCWLPCKPVLLGCSMSELQGRSIQ